MDPEVVHQLLLDPGLHLLPTGTLQPVLREGEACVVPVCQACPDEDMPPLVRTSKNVKFPGKKNLWDLGDVEEEGTATHEVHDDDPWQEDPDLVTVDSTTQDDPMNGWHAPPHYEGHKVDEPDAQVLLLVEAVPGQGPAQDEPRHGAQVESTEGRGAPEGIVDTCVKLLISTNTY